MASSYMDGNMLIPPPWDNKECNKSGEELLEFLTTCGLSWANKGTRPTFLNSRGHNSIIHITITNTAGCDLINDRQVSKSLSNSDHQYVGYRTVGRKTLRRKTVGRKYHVR